MQSVREWAALLGPTGTLAGAVLLFWRYVRTQSGSVRTSEAEQVWQQAEAIRKELSARIIALEAREERLIERLDDMEQAHEEEMRAIRTRMRALEEERERDHRVAAAAADWIRRALRMFKVHELDPPPLPAELSEYLRQ